MMLGLNSAAVACRSLCNSGSTDTLSLSTDRSITIFKSLHLLFVFPKLSFNEWCLFSLGSSGMSKTHSTGGCCSFLW